jgi:NADH dehydrogenase
VILIEGGPRILPTFPERLASRATRDLEHLGVQVWTSSPVTAVDAEGVAIGSERLCAATTLWAAGVRASELGASLGVPLDDQGRVRVAADLSAPGHPEVFVAGDLARADDANGEAYPGLAPVALQQGRFVAKTILRDLAGRPRGAFRYVDKGKLATIGRSKAVGQFGRFSVVGPGAWILWLVVHVYYLVGFKNRLFVVLQWAWSYLRFRRGARLIVTRE